MPDNIKNDGNKTKKVAQEVIGYFIAIVSAVIVAILIRIFIFEPFIVPTPSMEPTLIVGDKVIVNKLSYKLGFLARGDIIAFHSTTEDGKELLIFTSEFPSYGKVYCFRRLLGKCLLMINYRQILKER